VTTLKHQFAQIQQAMNQSASLTDTNNLPMQHYAIHD
jgi:hypothetical protein